MTGSQRMGQDGENQAGERDQGLSTVERIPACGVIFPSLRRSARKATADFPPVAPPGVTFQVVAAKGPLGMYWSERQVSSPLTGTHLVHLHSGRRRMPTEAPPLMEAAATTWRNSLALTPGSGLRKERLSERYKHPDRTSSLWKSISTQN